MILPWKIHVLHKDKERFVSSLSRVWDFPLDVYQSPLPDRFLIVCYAGDDEKTFLKIKFKVVEDNNVEEELRICYKTK